MSDESEPKSGGETAKNTRKNSTNEVPMIGLNDVVEFIRTIHEKGLERAPMPKVAEGTGYSNASSTPFYRRAAGARLFGLVSSRGADLTDLGQDCVKPTSEDATHQALLLAIQNIPAYVELLEQYNSRRINADILANWFERRFQLNRAGASSCAKAFIDSLRYAGALSADNLLSFSAERPAEAKMPTPVDATDRASTAGTGVPGDEGYRFELILEPKSQRKFVVFSPPSVTQPELKRIQDWLGFQLLVTPPEES